MPNKTSSTCARCHAPLPEDAIDRTLGLAQCSACGEVSELAPSLDAQISALDREVEQAFAAEPSERALRRQLLLADVPTGWTDVGREPTRLRLTWSSGGTAGWWAVASIWNVAMLGAVADNPGVLCSPFAWAGIAGLYYALVRTVNHTDVTCDGRTLTVLHGPLPWLMCGPVEVGAVAQLFVTESPMKVNHKPLWTLHARDGAGRDHVLLRWLATVDEARWVEAQIEMTTGLVDQPVRGEAPHEA